MNWKAMFYEGDSTRLYYARARWYDPQQGRFMSEDPTGLNGGLNQYSFAGGDHINGRDPSGACNTGGGGNTGEIGAATADFCDSWGGWYTGDWGFTVTFFGTPLGPSWEEIDAASSMCGPGFSPSGCNAVETAAGDLANTPDPSGNCQALGNDALQRLQNGLFFYGGLRPEVGGAVWPYDDSSIGGHGNRIALYRDAFSSMYNLYRVIAHEEAHVMPPYPGDGPNGVSDEFNPANNEALRCRKIFQANGGNLAQQPITP
jgi:RHS repeat-associated protein